MGVFGALYRLRAAVGGQRCPFGCGAQVGFCRCDDGDGGGDKKLTGRSRQTTAGRVTAGHRAATRKTRR